MAYVALNAGMNFWSFRPNVDRFTLLLINTDSSTRTLQLQLFPTIRRNEEFGLPPISIDAINEHQLKVVTFSKIDDILTSTPIQIEPNKSVLLFFQTNVQIEGYFKIILPVKVYVAEDGSIKTKSQTSRTITIGHQLTYFFDTTPATKPGDVRIPTQYRIEAMAPVFDQVRPEQGENDVNLIQSLPGLKANAKNRESVAYINALARDNETAKQEMAAFVRLASMVNADPEMRSNFNQMLREAGIHIALSSTEVDGNDLSPSNFTGLIGPKPEDPNPPQPPSASVMAYLERILANTSLIGPKPEDPTPPPPNAEVKAYLRRLLDL